MIKSVSVYPPKRKAAQGTKEWHNTMSSARVSKLLPKLQLHNQHNELWITYEVTSIYAVDTNKMTIRLPWQPWELTDTSYVFLEKHKKKGKSARPKQL